jgi:hypothetical protein
MTTFTEDELSWLHTFLEGYIEVIEEEGSTHIAEAARLQTLICDNPQISREDAEWLLEFAQDTDDDEPGITTLRAKLAALIEAAK